MLYIYWYCNSIMKISYISLLFVSIFLGIVSLSPLIYIADKITDLRILNKKNMSYGTNFSWCRPPFPNFEIFLWFTSSFVFFSKKIPAGGRSFVGTAWRNWLKFYHVVPTNVCCDMNNNEDSSKISSSIINEGYFSGLVQI